MNMPIRSSGDQCSIMSEPVVTPRIQRKLGVRSRVGIAAWACDTGHADPRS
jgi:hypothetical protein